MADTLSSVKGDFSAKFASEWKRRYALGSLISVIGLILPGIVVLMQSFLLISIFFSNGDYSVLDVFVRGLLHDQFMSEELVVMIYLISGVCLVSAGSIVFSAPRMLAPIAFAIIEPLDRSYLLADPVVVEDSGRNRFWTFSPPVDERVNRCLRARIWWLSGHPRSAWFADQIPKYLSLRYPDLPRSLNRPSLPVGRLGKFVIRQWGFAASGLFTYVAFLFTGNSILSVVLLYFGFIPYIQTLAYSAAYYKIITDSFPWEITPRSLRGVQRKFEIEGLPKAGPFEDGRLSRTEEDES